MEKAVLISIKPKWCKLIASGKKTVEVRKSAPKIETPFRCYIYCTKDGDYEGSGKVIGNFMCDKIMEGHYESLVGYCGYNTEWGNADCIPADELIKYGNYADTIYGWHISDLKIYDVPLELSSFKKFCNGACESCADYEVFQRYGNFVDAACTSHLLRPPQSWLYVDG